MKTLTAFTAVSIATAAAAAGGENDWPQWRGADGMGHATSTKLPVEWSEQNNVSWRTELPGRGWSSPVIADGKIWMTAAHEKLASEEDAEKRLKENTGGQPLTLLETARFHALCVDAESGELLHDIELFSVDEPQWVHRFNSYASPTPVVAGGKLFCHFGTFGTACVDAADGEVLWKKLDLHVMHENGPGSSPVAVGDLLAFNMDGSDEQFVVALKQSDGSVAWKTERSGKLNDNPQLKKAYGTPIVLQLDGGEQLVSPGANWIYGYDPATGEELWKVDYETLGFSNVARPVAGGGLLFNSTCFMRAEMQAIKLGPQPEVVWKYKKSVPKSPSPVLVGDLLYFVGDSGGLVTCLEAATGELVWSERIASGKYWSAPLAAAGKIYFHSEEGVTTVIEAGREFKVLAENELDGKHMASAAVSGDALFLRTDQALYRIEAK